MPSSVEAVEEITVKGDLVKCFSFFTDTVNIGSCIPGCEEVKQIDNTSATFKVRVKIGYISRTFELNAKLTDIKPSEHISFVAEGSDAEITGTVDLTSRDYGLVGIRYRVKIRPLSVTGKTAVSMVGKDLVKKQAADFADCVRSKLES